MRILQIDNYDHCCFCNHDSTHFSILRVSANALYDYYSRIFDSFIFIHKSNRLFFPSKGPLCLYDKQNNRWLLVDTKFLFSCSTRAHVLFSISRALLGIPIIRLLHQYHAHFWDFFHAIVMLVSRALLGLSFIGLLRLYLVHFKDSLSLDYHVSISCTFRILFHWIVAFVSRALLGSLSYDCHVSIKRTFRIPLHSIITLIYRAILGFSFIGWLRWYLK